MEVASAQWFHGRRFANSIRSQLAPSSLSMLRVLCTCMPKGSPPLQACCACSALACAPLLIVCFAATNCSLRSPHSGDSTPIPGAGFPIGFQFLLRDPVPRQGFPDFCTERHFSARFRMGSRGHAQDADSDARGKFPILSSTQIL